MDVQYGSVGTQAPEGFLPRRVHYTTLVRLNEGTKEGMISRKIVGDGFSTRDLPLPVAAQFKTDEGHMGADLVGRLDSVRVQGNNVEGWAWIEDTDVGRRAYGSLMRGTLTGNSVDLADVKVEVDFQFDDMDAPILVNFVESRIAATTHVMTPAFADARAELEAEITASLAEQGDLEIMCDPLWGLNVPELAPLTAAGKIVMPIEKFTRPEAEEKTPITVDENGNVYGHLGTWDSCHTGWIDRCVRIPRSATNYGSYCKSRVLTDQGHVWTGPIFLLGGHDFTREAINRGCANVENAWADVTVKDGKLGPWLSGVVRPGVSEEVVYAARASRISGHWLRGELYAICSVNAEGFDVPRVRFETDEDNEVEYLAASFDLDCDCDARERRVAKEALKQERFTKSVEGLLREVRRSLED